MERQEMLERTIIQMVIKQRGMIDVIVPRNTAPIQGFFALTDGANGKFVYMPNGDTKEIPAQFNVTDTGEVEWMIDLPAPNGNGNQSGTFPMTAIFIK